MNEQQVSNINSNKKNIIIIAVIVFVILGASIYWQRREANKAEVGKETGEANFVETKGILSGNLLPTGEGTMLLAVYFGNEKFSIGAPDDCKKVFVTERKIPKTTAVARTALLELFKGPTEEEKKEGYFTAIASGVEIKGLVIENGIAKADFNEALEAGADSVCRSLTIREQIVRTLKQFPTVKGVVISINGKTEGILQPLN